MALTSKALSKLVAHASWFVGLSGVAGVGCTTTIVEAPAPPPSDGSEEDAPGMEPDAQACSDDGIALPVSAVDSTPSTTEGASCEHESALADDGTSAILTWSGPSKGKVAGIDVGGCLLAQFGTGVKLKSLSMKMRPVSGGCGHECTPGADGCGSGWGVQVFAGSSTKKLQHVQYVSLTTTDFFEYRIAISAAAAAKYVALCKAPTGQDTDDIAIDALYGFCR